MGTNRMRWVVLGAVVLSGPWIAGCDRGRSSGSSQGGGAADPGTVVEGAERFEGEEFVVYAQPVEEAVVGTEVKVPIWATGKDPWKVNVEYPVKLEATGSEGLTVPGEALRGAAAARFDVHEVRFEVPVTPTAAGESRVTLKLKFGLCKDDRCITREAELSVAVRVGS